jgi:hypothetical protein
LLLHCCVDARSGPLHKLGFERKLVAGKPHRFLRHLNRYAFHLEQDLACLDRSRPVIERSFAGTHTNFGRLLGDRLIGKQANPDLAAALDETRHGHARSLDLTVGDEAGLHCLEPEIAKRQLSAAPGLAPVATLLLLPVLHFLRHQHDVCPSILPA